MRKILMVGILTFALIASAGLVSATEIDVDMDVDGGIVEVTADSALGTDEEVRTHFYGIGGFVGNFNANDNDDGILDALIGVITKGTTPWTRFEFDSSHNLGSQNSNDHKMVFSSWVEGETATMDMRMNNNPCQSQAERVSGQPMLSASDTTIYGYDMGYTMKNTERDDSYSNALMGVYLSGIGSGSLGKTQYGCNHLARGTGYHLNGLEIRSGEASATGLGTYTQTVFGANSFNFNGFSSPGGGSMTMTGNFNDGFNFQYSMLAK